MGFCSETEFRLAVEQYQNTVYRLAYSYLKNSADADDAFQEVFLRYFQRSKPFNGSEHEKAWLLTVTGNVCKSMLRSGWFRKTQALTEKEPVSEDSYDELLDAILRLPATYSSVLHLYYYEDYPVKTVANILGVRESAVQTRLQRGRDMLKKEVGVL